MKPNNGHPYYELGGQMKIGRKQADFCRRRVGGLLTLMELHRPLPELLANAYALGLADAAEYFTEIKP